MGLRRWAIFRRRRACPSTDERQRRRQVWYDIFRALLDFDRGIFPTLLWLYAWPRRLQVAFFQPEAGRRYTSPFRLGISLTFILFLLVTKLEANFTLVRWDPEIESTRILSTGDAADPSLQTYEDELLAVVSLLIPLFTTLYLRMVFWRSPYRWLDWLTFSFHLWSAILLPTTGIVAAHLIWGISLGENFFYLPTLLLFWYLLTVAPVRWYWRTLLAPVILLGLIGFLAFLMAFTLDMWYYLTH